jgi:hypothetical protein
MAGLPRRWRRKPGEVDWQDEVAARAVASQVTVHDDAETRRSRRSIVAIVTSWIGVVVVAVSILGWILLRIFDYHPTGAAGVIDTIFKVVIPLSGVVMPLNSLRKRAERHDERTALRIECLLEGASGDVEGFVVTPPARRRYERWLRRREQRLARLSPELASSWARPDAAGRSPDATVSRAELDSRRERIRELLRLSAQARPEAPAPQAPSARAITSS